MAAEPVASRTGSRTPASCTSSRTTASYRATYTAFDGASIAPQLIETTDFRGSAISQLAGPAAQNKGMALFPRRVGGRYVALSRWDRENNAIATSVDGVWWGDARTLQTPSRPWELLQLGNCGSPIETDAGWVVLTHGVGPMREYAIGALLLDLDDPTRVIGALRDPLLVPAEDERDGYVPNVVYSCGALRNGDQLLLPYGASDASVRFAVVDVPLLVERLTADGPPGDAREQLRVVRHHPGRGEALLDVVAAAPARQGADPPDRLDRTGDVVDEEAGPAGPDDLGHRPERVRDHRRAGRQRLDDREPEGLGEADEVQQRERATQQRVPLGRPDRADVGDAGRVQMRADERVEVLPVLHDPGDDQRHPGPPRDLDRQVGALVGMDAAEEQQISAGLVPEREGGEVDAVVDRRGVGQVPVAVRVADRDVVGDVVVGAVHRHDRIRREAVDGRHDRRRHQPAVGQRQEVELVAEHVELAGRSNAAAMCRPSYTLTS